jgi:hypothetical protein
MVLAPSKIEPKLCICADRRKCNTTTEAGWHQIVWCRSKVVGTNEIGTKLHKMYCFLDTDLRTIPFSMSLNLEIRFRISSTQGGQNESPENR